MNEEMQNTYWSWKKWSGKNDADVQPIIDIMEIIVVSKETECGKQNKNEQIDMEHD